MNSSDHATVAVETASGRLEGLQRGRIETFLGIPFATAPRWRQPVRVAPWAGVFNAQKPGPVAPQNPSAIEGMIGASRSEQSEDCLSLNVWSPGRVGAKRPVMVWIHGGAFVTGAGSSVLYNGQRLADAGDVVVVTINYRLGNLGFLRLADVSRGVVPATGAEGLADQICALEWVRDNISAFGGDPSNVTLFGESAGAMSVVALLASPLARGLFHKAISQSGGGHLCHSHEHANRIADVFVSKLGADVRDLEKVPVSVLLKAQLDLLAEIDGQHDPHRLGTMPFQPTVDGDILTARPIVSIRNGSARGVALLAGTTSEEWKLWTAMDPKIQAMDDDRLARWAERMFQDDAQKLLSAETGASTYERYVSMQTDRAFREPTLRLLEAQGAHASVHDYIFDWRSPALNGAFGACHALDLGFVFGTHGVPGADVFFGTGAAAEAVSGAMISAWASFAHSGAPSVPDQTAWPAWTPEGLSATVFGSANRATRLDHPQRKAAWKALPDMRVGS
jgi:para-nitrobenzyl esterase